MAYFVSGNLQKAETAANDALSASRSYDQKDGEGISLAWLGRILSHTTTASADCAEEHLIEGMKICEELSLKPWSAQGCLFLGELYAGSGKEKKAAENLRRAEQMFQEIGMDHWLGKTKKILERL